MVFLHTTDLKSGCLFLNHWHESGAGIDVTVNNRQKEKWSHRFLTSTASPQANVMPAIATGSGSGARVAAGTGVAGGGADSAVHGSSQVRRHVCFVSHQVYPAEPMQPWLSRSEPGIMAVVVAGIVVFSGATPDTGRTRSAAIRRMPGIRAGEHTSRFIYFTMVRRAIMINGLSLRTDSKTTGFLTF
jgi:hypothetical protein